MLLSTDQITEALARLPGWDKSDDDSLQRGFQFADFISAMEFVNAVASLAEDAGHHPDIFISYNQVMLSLSTHDASGITGKDVGLAREIGKLV